MDTITIPVEGMTCGGCEKSVERALTRTPGVNEAKASMATNNVTVTFDPAAATRDQLAQTIRRAGFKA